MLFCCGFLALENSGYRLPVKRITVNLSPADIRKEGSIFDLPISIALLAAYGYIPNECLENVLIVGELALNGDIRGVRGILSIVDFATLSFTAIRCCICATDALIFFANSPLIGSRDVVIPNIVIGFYWLTLLSATKVQYFFNMCNILIRKIDIF